METSRILYTPREEKWAKRSKRKAFFIILVMVSFLLLISLFIYLLRLPFWQIKSVDMVGLESIRVEEVREAVFDFLDGKYLWLIPKRSFWAANTKTLAETVRNKYPKIESLGITKRFPDKLIVNLAERRPLGIFCNDLKSADAVISSIEPDLRTCFFIDKNGFAYETAPSSSGSLIVKIQSDVKDARVGTVALDSALVGRMLFLAEEVKRVSGETIIGYELFVKLPREIKVTTNGGFKIIFNREDDFQNVFRVLQTVLDQEIKDRRGELDYIDLRFGNKVFYKFD